ncbi:MAG: DUF6933 domain-containing protein [Dissulfurispiraceae bacterium]
MRIIRCTQKLLKEIGNPPLVDTQSDTEGLGNWYSNIIRIDRKKCLLLTNEKTLYSFLIANVKKSNLKNIMGEFLINLSFYLQAEGFGLDIINKIMQEYQEIGFAKTASKKILGSMNQIAFEYEIRVQMKEGLEHVRVLEMNKEMNKILRTNQKGREYFYPVDALREVLSSIPQ